MIVTRPVKDKETDPQKLLFLDFQDFTPVVYVPDKPIEFNFANLYSCTTSIGQDLLSCVVWDSNTQLDSFTYKINKEKHTLEFIESFTYQRYYQCTPISLRVSGYFLGVHCNIENTNTENILIYYKGRKYTISTFELVGESTDFHLSSFKPDTISLAIAGQDPRIYLITNQSYLDSNTNSIKDVEGIKLVINNKIKSDVDLVELFLDNSKPDKPEDNSLSIVAIIGICVGGILLIAILVCVYLSVKEKKEQKARGVYNSMDSKSQEERSRANTIRDPLRESMMSSKSDLKSSRIGLTRSIIKRPKKNIKITASGFYDD